MQSAKKLLEGLHFKDGTEGNTNLLGETSLMRNSCLNNLLDAGVGVRCCHLMNLVKNDQSDDFIKCVLFTRKAGLTKSGVETCRFGLKQIKIGFWWLMDAIVLLEIS